MKRVVTATCLAAAFAVGLAAQSTTSSTQTPSSTNQRGAGPRTVTGCLRAGDTAGSYLLTDVVMPGARAGDTTGTTSGTSGGTTAGATGTGGRPMAPMSITLMPASDVDLKAHVGHKIEVTGSLAGGGRRTGGTGTTAGGTTTGGTSGGGSTASTAAGGTTTGAASGTGGQAGRGPRSMSVTSVRMVSESCS